LNKRNKITHFTKHAVHSTFTISEGTMEGWRGTKMQGTDSCRNAFSVLKTLANKTKMKTIHFPLTPAK